MYPWKTSVFRIRSDVDLWARTPVLAVYLSTRYRPVDDGLARLSPILPTGSTGDRLPSVLGRCHYLGLILAVERDQPIAVSR